MKATITTLALFSSFVFYAQTAPQKGDLLPDRSPKKEAPIPTPKADIPRLPDDVKVDIPRLNDADADLKDIKIKTKDDLLPIKTKETSGSGTSGGTTSRTDTTKDGVNSTLTIKNKGNQTTQPQRDKSAIGTIKKTNNDGVINPTRDKDEAPKDGFTKVKGNGVLTQPNGTKDIETGGIKPIRTSGNPNNSTIKNPKDNVKNDNNPIKSAPDKTTTPTDNPKDKLGKKPTNESVHGDNKQTIEQVKEKSSTGKDLIKKLDKTPKNDKPKVDVKAAEVNENKVKDEEVKK